MINTFHKIFFSFPGLHTNGYLIVSSKLLDINIHIVDLGDILLRSGPTSHESNDLIITVY